MAGQRFDYFVVLAGMRTGSNLLEEQLSAMPGLVSHGELFNPHFFGKPKVKERFGFSITARDADPVRVIGAMKSACTGSALPGFRLFFDHHPQAIQHVLADRRAAKIILSRRPIDSYVSLKIARKTDQWWLSDLSSARVAKVAFDAEEYAAFLGELADFQKRVLRELQVTGQTGFFLRYEDLSDPDVLSGLGAFLGADGPPDREKIIAKVQNPTPLAQRLTNPRVAEEAIRGIALPDLAQSLIYEPGRGPGLKFFRACAGAPLLYMPIRGGGLDPIPDWLTQIDPKGEVSGGMTQRDLRKWKRLHPGHRSFTVLRHPLPRAHDAFCRFLLSPGDEAYADVRAALIETYGVPLPAEGPDETWTIDRHREALIAFLAFLGGNLGGQTSLRVDFSWATQAQLLTAIAEFAVPDRVVREETLARDLENLSVEIGLEPKAPPTGFDTPTPFDLSDVVNDAVEIAAETAYRRDYIMFGFRRWSAEREEASFDGKRA